MRWVMPQPCIGSRARVLRISRSSVPCKRSDFGLVMILLQRIWRKDTRPLVDSQEKKEGSFTECLSLRRHAIQKFDNLSQYLVIAHTPRSDGLNLAVRLWSLIFICPYLGLREGI